MGLLDTGIEDPTTAGLLSLGLRLMSTPGKFGTALGQAGLGALQDVNAAKAANMQRQAQMTQQQMAALQLQQAQRQYAEQLAQDQRDEAFRAKLPSPAMQANQAALAGGGGPSLANAAKVAPVDQKSQMLYDALQARQIKPMDYISLTAKDDSPLTLKEGETLIDRRTFKPIVGNPKNDLPPIVREYEYAKAQGYQGTLQQFVLEQKKAGATNVNVKTGDSLAGQVGPMMKETWTAANGAVQTAQAANELMASLNSGKVITGPFANARMTVAQIASMTPWGGKDTQESVENTRRAITSLAQMTLQGRKQMTGQGAITESESKLAERAMSGDINFTAGELRQLANAANRAAKFTYDQHQAQLQTAMANKETAGVASFFRPAPWPSAPIQMRQPAAPAIPAAPQQSKVMNWDDLPDNSGALK